MTHVLFVRQDHVTKLYKVLDDLNFQKVDIFKRVSNFDGCDMFKKLHA